MRTPWLFIISSVIILNIAISSIICTLVHSTLGNKFSNETESHKHNIKNDTKKISESIKNGSTCVNSTSFDSFNTTNGTCLFPDGKQSRTAENDTSTQFLTVHVTNLEGNHTKRMTMAHSQKEASNITKTHSVHRPAARRESNDETVIYSWTFFCHGTTSPLEPYPNDRYSPSYWKFQLNWLTDIGEEEMYNLGTWIRKRYSKLCNRYHPGTVEILSEASDSTFMSAECLLTGLFPANSTPVQGKTLPVDPARRTWQPIPVHTVQSTMDLLGASNSLACRQYDIELDDVTDSPPWSTLPERYYRLINYIADHCGYSFIDASLVQLLQTLYEVYYDLKTEELANLTLPSWTKSVYPEPLQSIAAKYLGLFTFTDTLQRFKAGPTIGKIVNSMEKKIKGDLQEDLKLYSGSHYSIASIMNAFSVFNQLVPPFASAFVIELSKSKDQFFVSLYYKNSSASSPHTLNIPNCDNKCPFEKFSSLMKGKVPSDWSAECDVIPIAALTLSTPLLLAGLVVIIVLIFLALLLLVKCCRCFNKKTSTISNY